MPQTGYDGVHSRFWPPESEALTDVATPLNQGGGEYANSPTALSSIGPKVTTSPGGPERGKPMKTGGFLHENTP